MPKCTWYWCGQKKWPGNLWHQTVFWAKTLLFALRFVLLLFFWNFQITQSKYVFFFCRDLFIVKEISEFFRFKEVLKVLLLYVEGFFQQQLGLPKRKAFWISTGDSLQHVSIFVHSNQKRKIIRFWGLRHVVVRKHFSKSIIGSCL